MRFTRLRIENYRAFASLQELELKPLTLVYGYNHAGKSALLRTLPLLADSSTGLYPAPLALDSRAIRDGSFDDLRCRARPDAPVSFELEATEADDTSMRWSSQIDERARQRRQFVAAWEFERRRGDLSARITATWNRAEGPPRERGGLFNLTTSDQKILVSRVRFEGLTPLVEDSPPQVEELLSENRAFLRHLRADLQWLESIRSQPERRERTTGAPPLQMKPNGEGAAQMLAADLQDGGEIVQRVAAFYRGDLTAPGSYDFWVTPEADAVRLMLAPRTAPTMKTDLVDAGEGMVQVLPVLVALARAARGRVDDARLVVLEQPELHLHPRMEVRLGEHLCQIASHADPPTVVVETHSEALLLSIQRALLEGKLDPGRVAICWVRQIPEGESIVERVSIDEHGRLDAAWPPGSFQEVVNLARDVVKLRMARESA